MKNNPEYFRLIKEENSTEHFQGFKRIITEHLPAGSDKWQLEEIEHTEAVLLSYKPSGISLTKRAKLNVE